MTKLHVVNGTPAPDTPKERVRVRLRKAAVPWLIQCPRCAGREVIETRVGMESRNGRPAGGTRTIICAACFMRGERIVIR